MNVYFGKIAPKNKEQIDGHYYRAPKNWPGYSGLSDGDYVYMLCQGVTHLWKALPYDEEQGVRPFEVVLPSIGNCTAFLAHIKYFKLSMELAIKSHRQTKGMAFFKLDVDSSFSEDMILNPATYSDPSIFRKVIVRKDETSCVDGTYDLQFYFDSGELKYKRPLNTDDSYFADYRNNLKLVGGNRPKKDKVLNLVKNPASIDQEFDYESELDLLRVYDAFMVDYNAREDDVVEVTSETRFWCFNHNYENCSDEARKEFIKWAKSNSSCKMQQEYEVEGLKSKQVTPNWENIGSIKKDDIVFFRAGDNVFAYGRAVVPQKTSDNVVHKSYKEVIKNKSSGQENSTTSFDGLVFFDDAECFYEDFSEHTWAQRVDVEEWFGFTKKSFNVQSMDFYKDGNVYLTIRELKPSAASKIIEFFGGQLIMVNKEDAEMQTLLENKKNIILQGAPGTGKTYKTAELALSVIGDVPIRGTDEDEKSFHKRIMDTYNAKIIKLNRDGSFTNPNAQIGFVTFHQSMDYEDFVEGIKPKTNNGQISYEIENGIFKAICENASQIKSSKKSEKIDFSNVRIFKMSLGEKGKTDAEIFDYCSDNNVIALGWGGNVDFSDCKTREEIKAKDSSWGAFAIEVFKLWMRVGDIVLISDGNRAIKAIARITGEYEFHADKLETMRQYRNVEWLYIGDSIPISKLYDKKLSQQSIYAFGNRIDDDHVENGSIKEDVINDIITGEIEKENLKNYVLIIDEINRGNVSKIFGELISLLEADKRVGGDHPLTVTLPYSKESFSVPSNLYIIGTMNTTDRSVGSIDYAVRRRFAFYTLKADESAIENYYKGKDESLKNKAIELFGKVRDFLSNKDNRSNDMEFDDLMVGHSYFMAESLNELELKWKYEVIPLLKEYQKDGLLRHSAKIDDILK